jgi:phosphogluconate dehydratase
VPSAIHVTPEASHGGLLAKVRDGDRMVMDVHEKRLELLVDKAELARREAAAPDLEHNRHGIGRELFALMRGNVGSAEHGATIFDAIGEERA